jgi:hypothetical protein
MNEKIVEVVRSKIGGGPIMNRGYDQLKLTVDHDATMPDGKPVRLPAGTILVMCEPGPGGYDQVGGDALRPDQ